MNRLGEIIDTFASVDDEMRLELLLDFSRKLPPLPERFHEARDAGANRVHECMTPVFMWIENEDGLRIYVDVAEEAPTVKGFLSLLIRAYEGAPPEEMAEIPPDLLNRLHLDNQIRMNRAIGLSAVMGRMRKKAKELAEGAEATRHEGA